MPKTTMLVLTLIALLGFTACAKYPVVVDVSTPSPTAATQVPAR